MSFGRFLLGTLLGGIISAGAIIGITFLGSMVPWWALLLIGAGGCLFGGFVAGLIAQGAGKGALAGLFSGLIVLVGVFLFSYFYYKGIIIGWISTAPDVATLAGDFVTMLGMGGTPVGTTVVDWITTNVPTLSAIQDFANTKFIWFALILGGIFGVLASIVNLGAGLVGGLFTRKKEDKYDSYY